jgi:chromate transporter
VSTSALAAYFLRLGAVGFGGPIALVARMHRDLVEVRGWVSETQYREGLTLAQLAPGPLAAQLAMYLGWTRSGVGGAALAGLAFVAPSLSMVLVLAVLYVRFGGMTWLQEAFYGAGAGVIAVIARSTVKLARATLHGDPLLWTLFAVNGVVTAWTGSERISVIAASGLVVVATRGRVPGGVATALMPSWLLAATGVASAGVLGEVFWFFIKAGLVVFGSGLAIVPFLYGGVVERFGWLTERQFLDAVAISMLTPGPVVVTVAFIGYLVAGIAGGLAAAAGVFLPAYVVVVLVAPQFHRLAGSVRARAFVDGVTAAVTGALAGAVVVLGRRTIVDAPTLAIAAGSLAALLLWRPAREPLVLLAAATVGVALRRLATPA